MLLGVKMMNVSLIKLTKEYYDQVSEMIDEWKLDQEINHTNHSPWQYLKTIIMILITI